MSTYYRPSEPISLDDIKNNKILKKQGFKIVDNDDYKYFYIPNHTWKKIEYSEAYIHFAKDKDNNVIDLFRYGMNNPESILDPLSDVFDVLFISEYEDEYHDLASTDTSVITFNFQDFHQEQ
jgi:hypothetical protein